MNSKKNVLTTGGLPTGTINQPPGNEVEATPEALGKIPTRLTAHELRLRWLRDAQEKRAQARGLDHHGAFTQAALNAAAAVLVNCADELLMLVP